MKKQIKCKIKDCNRDAMYQEQQVCQKHYFRFMRNGTYDLVTKRKPRGQRKNMCNPKGYIMVYKPGHPLAQKSGFVYEHRFLMYAKLHGTLDGCELCGKEITWKQCHVDHIDCDVKNNSIENLRPLCNACNTRRFYPEHHTRKYCTAVTYKGLTKTPNEWTRHPKVTVCRETIARRIRQGYKVEDALFMPSKTLQPRKLF